MLDVWKKEGKNRHIHHSCKFNILCEADCAVKWGQRSQTQEYLEVDTGRERQKERGAQNYTRKKVLMTPNSD